ncbi:NAD(P)/FAD-dependent oxidoreductase [Olivibacter sp. XZL3]|uniref:NAD(P)/FAD-dependent oxidoreductase n=1 Tax=Olivibacter sp. XZL3 TaxID=1735116 RepID=UPI0010670B20|nr:NAD(P)/FAD-dependent oxidoreductase [Olivibacter sp. XZL3]
MTEQKIFDVIIIGGSYAGLSAAMALGRSLRSTLVIDSGQPCNRQTPHSHNFLTQDGKRPAEIALTGRRQVEQYPSVQFHDGLAVLGTQKNGGFEITVGSGASFWGKKLLFASGIKDEMPDIPGFAACWGISVVHCPYCHGYEFRNRKTGLMANGERALHMASLIRNLTADLTIFTNGDADFTDDQLHRLKARQIAIIEQPVSEILHQNGHLDSLLLQDGNMLELDALYASVPFVQHCPIPESLGCILTEQGHIQVDQLQKTSVTGVFACGDNVSPMRSVANAVASGNFTGAIINKELVEHTDTL